MKTTLTIDEIIKQFSDEIDTCSDTKELYLSIVKMFYMWCNDKAPDKRCIKKADIVAYKNWMIANKKKPSYINLHLISIKKYFKFLKDNDFYENVAQSIKFLKVGRAIRTMPLNDLQIENILKSVDTTTKIGMRDMCILSIMFETGCRVVELHRMNIEDIFTREGQTCIYTQPKGSNESIEFKNINCSYPLLNQYLGNRTTGPLFISEKSKGKTRLSRLSVQNMIRKYYFLAGITDPMIKPHSIRYTFVRYGIITVSNTIEMQSLMSHRSINSTAPYMIYPQMLLKLSNKPGKMIYQKFFNNIY